jgi:16S rRNA A1518/A1519 N6-dimethyltransferase RsmA/KsgA/DIM1 with predicted DNA glycosylase/AP lyase activity
MAGKPLPTKGTMKPDLGRDQAFMVDPRAIRWIVGQADLRETDTVLEIGAGTGNLTRAIAKSGARVIAVEKDLTLERELRKNLRGFSNAEIVIGNALKLLDSRGIRFNKLVSNIPYAISEPLIQRLIFHEFEMAVLTLPKGFARILIAAPWEKGYSRLSFTFQRFFYIQAYLDLQMDSFRPRPRTNSVVLKFLAKPRNSVFCQLLLRPGMRTKNALREALCSAKGHTKNQARITIKRLNLTNLLEKRVSELSVEDIRTIVRKAAEFRED